MLNLVTSNALTIFYIQSRIPIQAVSRHKSKCVGNVSGAVVLRVYQRGYRAQTALVMLNKGDEEAAISANTFISREPG